jgi:hypothetical protein
MMKILRACLPFAFVFVASCGQQDHQKHQPEPVQKDSTAAALIVKPVSGFPDVDVSPMDMSYFPVDYPKMKMGKSVKTAPLARVIYSRPHLQGRHLFHELEKYGKPWRLGANESTELDLYSDALIQGKTIKAGRYVLYCIPQPDHWTIILNSNIDSWGLVPDPSKDLFKFDIPVMSNAQYTEYFTMFFEKTETGADLLIAWDNVEVKLPIGFK